MRGERGDHIMLSARPCQVPAPSLLHRYKEEPGFTDCYMVEVLGAFSQEAFVEAFYTSPLFKLERVILTYLASMPSTDADARALACGKLTKFSAWTVERQSSSELLLADITGRTRSWLMAVSGSGSNQAAITRLYFGSAVIPRSHGATTTPSMGWPFYVLAGFHRLYSRLLLSAASRHVKINNRQRL